MPLEAVILQHGSFSGLSQNVKGLSFWSLGGADRGYIRPYKSNLEALIDNTLKGFRQLIQACTLCNIGRTRGLWRSL